jgi:predicted Zn-dependent peptidase
VRSNSAMAAGLAAAHALTGTWRTSLIEAAAVEALTAADVRDVTARTFRPDNCFTGYVLPMARTVQ